MVERKTVCWPKLCMFTLITLRYSDTVKNMKGGRLFTHPRKSFHQAGTWRQQFLFHMLTCSHAHILSVSYHWVHHSRLKKMRGNRVRVSFNLPLPHFRESCVQCAYDIQWVFVVVLFFPPVECFVTMATTSCTSPETCWKSQIILSIFIPCYFLNAVSILQGLKDHPYLR